MSETATIHPTNPMSETDQPANRAPKNPLVGNGIEDTAHNVACLLKYLEGFTPDMETTTDDHDDYRYGYSLMNRLLIVALESHNGEAAA